MNRIEKLIHLKNILIANRDAGKILKMSRWGGLYDPKENGYIQSLYYDEIDFDKEIIKKHACTTACCAFGTACLDPVFQNEGLYAIAETPVKNWKQTKIQTVEEFNNFFKKNPCARFTPCYRGSSDFEAAAEFFEIHQSIADFLFGLIAYNRFAKEITYDDVIERIDMVLQNPGCEVICDDDKFIFNKIIYEEV